MIPDPLELAQLLEQYVSLGVFVFASGLGILSALAWRRERDPRMGIVALGYGLFAVYGLIGFLEYVLLPVVPYEILELVEHGSALLIFAGLLAFFVALIRY
ncbi:hypothetical protein [Halovenus salina]|uniref:hypothetical protein n=1 Tax=Halovenus salina TaxID=1510225 RepID=UPI0022610051|nr:hypothetical protein [Halovenus salina]